MAVHWKPIFQPISCNVIHLSITHQNYLRDAYNNLDHTDMTVYRQWSMFERAVAWVVISGCCGQFFFFLFSDNWFIDSFWPFFTFVVVKLDIWWARKKLSLIRNRLPKWKQWWPMTHIINKYVSTRSPTADRRPPTADRPSSRFNMMKSIRFAISIIVLWNICIKRSLHNVTVYLIFKIPKLFCDNYFRNSGNGSRSSSLCFLFSCSFDFLFHSQNLLLFLRVVLSFVLFSGFGNPISIVLSLFGTRLMRTVQTNKADDVNIRIRVNFSEWNRSLYIDIRHETWTFREIFALLILITYCKLEQCNSLQGFKNLPVI